MVQTYLTVVKQRDRRQAVPSRSPTLLVVVIEGLGHVEMNYEPYI